MLTADAFSKQTSSWSGLSPKCRACCKAYQRLKVGHYRHKKYHLKGYRENPGKVKARIARYFSKPEKRYLLLAKSAIPRGWTVELTMEQWLALIKDDACTYCGDTLPLLGHGLDRKDNNLGYTAGNCVACCSWCNRLKSSLLSYAEMMQLAPVLKQIRLQRAAKGAEDVEVPPASVGPVGGLQPNPIAAIALADSDEDGGAESAGGD